MLINLIKFAKSGLVTHAQYSGKHTTFRSSFKMFGTEKGKSSTLKQENLNQNNRAGPTVIEISKQQFIAMRQFVDNIKLSTPAPDITPSSPNHDLTNSDGQGTSQPSKQKSPDLGEVFSSEEHILSFKLLKLSEPHQFASIFNQHKSQDKINLKLIILYRYVSLNGLIEKNSPKSQQKLAYEYLETLKDNMAKLEQSELEQFLQLYLNLYNARKEAGNKINLPLLNLEKLNEQLLPLIETPSHKNSRVLILLLRFWQIQSENINDQPFKISMAKILKHYELICEFYESSQLDYPLSQIAYIGIWAYFCNMQEYFAIPLLVQRLKSINRQPRSTDQKKIFKAVQIILQGLEKLGKVSPKILNNFDQLALQVTKYLDSLTKQPLSLSKREEIQQNFTQEKEDKILDFNTNQNSGEVSSLLHSCLLALLQKSNSNVLKLAVPIISVATRNIFTYLEKTNFLPLAQYSQYWQSGMIMFKLLKTGSTYIGQKQLNSFVASFMGKLNIQDCIKSILNEETGAVIEQFAEDVEKRLFETLVGFRIIVPTNFKLDSFVSEKEAVQISTVELAYSEAKNRKALQDLLVGYRVVIQNMYKCGLVSSSQDPQVHNLIISCMISEAYISEDGKTTYIRAIMSPTVAEILSKFGTKHRKYGEYIVKLLKKYKEY